MRDLIEKLIEYLDRRFECEQASMEIGDDDHYCSPSYEQSRGLDKATDDLMEAADNFDKETRH